MDTCSAVMLSGHKPHVADAVIEARYAECHGMPVPAGSPLSSVVARCRHCVWRLARRASAGAFKSLGP